MAKKTTKKKAAVKSAAKKPRTKKPVVETPVVEECSGFCYECEYTDNSVWTKVKSFFTNLWEKVKALF